MKRLMIPALLAASIMHGSAHDEKHDNSSMFGKAWNVVCAVAASPIDLLDYGLDSLRESRANKSFAQSSTAKWLDEQLDTPNKQKAFGAAGATVLAAGVIYALPSSLFVGSASTTVTVAGSIPSSEPALETTASATLHRDGDASVSLPTAPKVDPKKVGGPRDMDVDLRRHHHGRHKLRGGLEQPCEWLNPNRGHGHEQFGPCQEQTGNPRGHDTSRN